MTVFDPFLPSQINGRVLLVCIQTFKPCYGLSKNFFYMINPANTVVKRNDILTVSFSIEPGLFSRWNKSNRTRQLARPKKERLNRPF
jgi:hypothetical protein